jgi:hypothetical protein
MTSLGDFSKHDICEVTPQGLRDRFAELDIWYRSISGDLSTTVIADGHPSPHSSGEPFCTRSQRLLYRDEHGNQVAQAHQYLREDGTLGASGVPDPKLILHEGTVYGAL